MTTRSVTESAVGTEAAAMVSNDTVTSPCLSNLQLEYIKEIDDELDLPMYAGGPRVRVGEAVPEEGPEEDV